MTQIHETAYPRFQSKVRDEVLNEIYTPTEEERHFAEKHARKPLSKLRLLVHLKTFQRLGYFPSVHNIPQSIIRHIGTVAGIAEAVDEFNGDVTHILRWKHAPLVREYLGVKPFSSGGAIVMNDALLAAARTKDIIADIINAGIEKLIQQRYELPAFSTLRRSAKDARSVSNRYFYDQVSNSLSDAMKEKISALLVRQKDEPRSPWNRVKDEPGIPTAKKIREFLYHLRWLQTIDLDYKLFDEIPEAKVKRFADEALALNVTRMGETVVNKQLTLAAALISRRNATALDEISEMFLRSWHGLQSKGREALDDYRTKHQTRTDGLIDQLKRVATIWRDEEDQSERVKGIDHIFADGVFDVIKQCDEHLFYAKNNALPFYLLLYMNRRANFFRFLETVALLSTSEDKTLELAIAFLRKHRRSRKDKLTVAQFDSDRGKGFHQLLDLSFIPESWWKLVTGKPRGDDRVYQVDRRYLELCVFSCLSTALKSGDICVDGSSAFNDYRRQLVSWDEYHGGIGLYCEQVGISRVPEIFVEKLKSKLAKKIHDVDKAAPSNNALNIQRGEVVLRKVRRKPAPKDFKTIDNLIAERMPKVDLLDVLVDTEHWLGWTSKFRPISGFERKLDNAQERYIATAFCYGTYMGPVQTARSLRLFDRKQISFVHQHHITEDVLHEIITSVNNRYNKLPLVSHWGSGKSASADGTKWDVYEQNLLNEYHIRYGGWGGLGYYHVSDTYIALFSNFTSCGAWEGIHILDIFKNQSDIQPDTLHGDTHAQSMVIFGLAFLLGIRLMPRIRKWKDLNFYLPYKGLKPKHISQLFTDEPIDWRLIVKHLPDMLRVALSIRQGRITPSTILRRLGTYSKKNKLYFAFRELARAIRTIFLLDYISDLELRRNISAATNKSEAWNSFIDWIAFGKDGNVPGRSRDDQQKSIKYNHLVANLLVFHCAATLTRVIEALEAEGYTITDEMRSLFSPYRTRHVNRFGSYKIRIDRNPPPSPHLGT